jgi:hypothetical protein
LEEYVASIFSVEETGIKQGSSSCLLNGNFFIKLLVSTQYGGENFLGKVGRPSAYYTALYPRI